MELGGGEPPPYSRDDNGLDSLREGLGEESKGVEEEGSSETDEDPIEFDTETYNQVKWSSLSGAGVHGADLKSPRIRAGPGMASEHYRELPLRDLFTPTAGKSRRKKRREVKERRREIENWGELEEGNFSYQELGEPYQYVHLKRVMNQLKACKRLNLAHNRLRTLNGASFPSLRRLYLQGNFFTSVAQLPNAPLLTHVNLTDNYITHLNGLSKFRSLESLDLRDNPVCMENDYRARAFQALPLLRHLDGCPPSEDDLRLRGALIISREQWTSWCVLM